MKKLSMRVLDQNVLDKTGLTITTDNLDNYFGRKDNQAFAVVRLQTTSKLTEKIYLARKKYIPRVMKYLLEQGVHVPMIMSREQANKTFARANGIRFDVSEIEEDSQ